MLISRKDLIHDISNLAYVIADVSEGRESPHTLHQTFDICQEGNIDRVNSLIDLAASIVADAVSRVGRLIQSKGDFRLSFFACPKHTALKIKQLTIEFIISTVFHSYLSVTLPDAAPPWKTHKAEIMSDISTAVDSAVAATLTPAVLTRRLCPF